MAFLALSQRSPSSSFVMSMHRAASPATSNASVTSSRIEAILQGAVDPEPVEDVHMEEAAAVPEVEELHVEVVDNTEASEPAMRAGQRRRVAVPGAEGDVAGGGVAEGAEDVRASESRVTVRRRRRDASPVDTASDDGDVDEGAAAQPDLRKRRWVGTADVNSMWFSAVSKETALEKVSFDLRLEHGQTRPLVQAHVEELVESLRERPPLTPLKVTLWEHTGERKLFVIGGQHLCRALMLLRDDRVKDGMTVPHWMTHVLADIMRSDTPLNKRKLIAGSLNASGRLHRSATIADCVRLMMRDDPGVPSEPTELILQAVEQCGLNTNVSPVCYPESLWTGLDHDRFILLFKVEDIYDASVVNVQTESPLTKGRCFK